jgi:predicted nucleotidyltransferase
VAARHGVRLVVFGSLAEGRFHRDSDLDVALDGPEDRLAAAEGEVFSVVSGHGLPVDVVRLSHAPPRLAERIRMHGRDPAALG